MLEFDQFLGFIFFTFMALCGFWGIKFLALTAPAWVNGWLMLKAKEKKHGDTTQGTRPIISEQEGFELLYKK